MLFLARCKCFAGSGFLFLVLFFSTQTVTAQVVMEKIEGHEDTSSWALHESGRIFAAIKSSDTVVEYDIEGDEVRTYDVGSEPTEMIVKGDHLVVACAKSSAFSVIDLKTNKVAGKISVAGKGLYSLFSSKVDNGFVYGITSVGSSSSAIEIVQVDLKQMKVRERTTTRGWGESRPIHIAMSADGKWLVPDRRGLSSPSGANLMRVDEDEFTFTQIRAHRNSFGQIKAGPANRFWTLGNKLYRLDMVSPVRNFSGSPVAIHPTYDLAVSFLETGLSFAKFSDAQELKKHPFQFTDEKPKKTASRRSKSIAFLKREVLIGFDAGGSHAIAATGKYCCIIDLNDLEIPLQPMLMLDIPTVVETKVGKPIEVPLQLTNRKLTKKAEIKLVTGPEGARISSKGLVWTPTAKDIGRHTVKISAKLDDTVDDVTIDLNVKATKMKLNFNITGVHVDDQGKYAIAWGKKIPKNLNMGRSQTSSSDEVAIFDLESQEVIVQKPLAAGVQSAVIQQPYVFLLPKTGNVLFRFDAKTLGGSKRMFLKDKCVGVITFVKNQIGTISGDHSYTLNLVDPETMKSSGDRAMRYNPHLRNAMQGIRNAGPGLIEFQSQLLDEETGLVAMMESNPGLKSLVTVQPNHSIQSHQMRDYPRKMYGRCLHGNGLISATGSTISRTQNNKRVFSSPHHPVAFAIRPEQARSGQAYETKTYLETLSLVDGEVLDSRVFNVESSRGSRSHNFYNNGVKTFFPFKEKLVYVKGNEIFSIPIDLDVVKSAPLPLYFPTTKVPALGIDRPYKLPFKAIGGKGNPEYQLLAEYEGISVDSSSGTVTIDTPLLWKNYVKALASPTSNAMRLRASRNRNQQNTPKPEEQFEELFGKPLPAGKLPFVVPIQLAATDDESQEDRISVYAMVLGDKSAIDQIEKDQAAKLKEMEVARAKQRQEYEANKMASQAKAIAEAQANRVRQSSNGQTVAELEKRMRRMEATLDVVLQKLESIEKAQGK